MAELLAYVGVTDKASFRAWCLRNHPDKCPGDPDATRRFQAVSAAYNRLQPGGAEPPPAAATTASRPRPRPPPSPQRNEFDAMAERIRRTATGKCSARVAGVPGGLCHRDALKGKRTCFYHEPGTDHLRFVEGDPARFFGNVLFRRDKLAPERTERTCTARRKDGFFCTQSKKRGCEQCATHARMQQT